MKLLSDKECKDRLLQMLKFLDKVCKDNNIKYSIIGGTAIGALRNKGFLPWDDDIDIILLKDEFDKLKEALINEQNEDYKILYPGINDTYYFTGMKLIDIKTTLKEDLLNKIDDYGLFIDIFNYNSFPKNKIKQKFYLFTNRLFDILFYYGFIVDVNSSKNFLKKVRNVVAKGIKRILKHKIRLLQKYNHDKTSKYIYSCWPVYSLEKEIQERNNFLEYTKVQFEDTMVMITKDYDKVLTKTFGDYMTPPKKNKRRNHNLKVYLR